MLRVPKGSRLFVINQLNKSIVQVECVLHVEIEDIKKLGGSQMQYEESNRYKLAQAIKKTGLKVGELSIAANGNVNYFGNYHNKSRFNERGDISETRLNELLTDLAFAEREVLGIGAKTVEEPSDAEIQMLDLASSVKEKPKSNKPLFIGAAVVIFIILILFILNNSQVV